MMPERSQWRNTGMFLLVAGVIVTALLTAFVHQGKTTIHRSLGPAPLIEPSRSLLQEGAEITIRSSAGGALSVASSLGNEPGPHTGQVVLRSSPDRVHASRLLSIPLSMQWRHPKSGLPAGQVVRAAEYDAIGRLGPVTTRTFIFQDHAPLPVMALVMDHGALFDPDTGLMVVGNAIIGADRRIADPYHRDHRWWKYPGNFMGRGKAWERQAHIEMITGDGILADAVTAKVRINGQMTRGFPQHSLRLLFDRPVDPWSGKAQDAGHTAMVLRAAGNDQVKAMMRDPFQQRLCTGLSFATSAAKPCVVYINGAYWGVYHLRDRMDEQELSRRHGLPEKEITILEDAAVLYRGDPSQVGQFNGLITLVEQWDGTEPDHKEHLLSALDVDGFVTYMASQLIMGNMDWPEQNVKYWKYTGTPIDRPFADGRWYFIMGDSDLGFGANAPASADIFVRVRGSNSPVARLFRGLMRSPEFEAAFRGKVIELLDGPLSTTNMLHGIERMVNEIGPEMDRHTARWRKPLDKSAWEKEVEVLRNYARQREGHVRDQIARDDIPGTR